MDTATCSGLLLGGNIQAAELPFDIGAWTSICPPPQGSGANPAIICGSTSSYAWVGLSFNHQKFPGNDEHFRRAVQFLQDYSFIQTTILQSVEGTATNQPAPCGAYPTACNPAPMTAAYGSSQNLVAAGQELEQVTGGGGLFCDNAGVPCAGTYTASSEWCLGSIGTGSGCGTGTPFNPELDYRSTLFRNFWGAAIINWFSQIGVTVAGRGPEGGGAASANCFVPNGEEIITPGVYNAITGYNSLPVTNASAIAADTCGMLTYGFISSAPTLEGLLLDYNSQTAGSGGVSTGNVYDDPAAVYAPDTTIGLLASQPHTFNFNLDYTTNQVEFATSGPAATTAAQNFMNAYALNVPTVMAFYENTLYVNNAQGWSGFVSAPVTGPNELGGLYFTGQDAHTCSATSCTMNINNTGSSIGGNLNVALEQVSDASGLNVVYGSNWAWQADVFGSIYDTAVATPANHFNDVNYYVNYMTSSFSTAPLPGATVLGTGGTWYYFQEPCANPNPPATYATREGNCQGHSGPNQTPGPLQRGIGLLPAARTINNGEVITFTLKPGIYFYDGVQVTANDILFSLNWYNIAGGPNMGDQNSPATSLFAGPLGLVAAHLLSARGLPCSVNCPTIQIYLGSQSFWGLPNVITGVLPAHVFKYFNPDHVATAGLGTVDTSKPYGVAATAFSIQGAPHPPATSWMWYLPNLEIGSGPYYLQSWNGGAGTGVDVANPFYFNPNFQAEANYTVLNPGNGYTITTPLIIDEYNPTFANINCGPSAPGPILPGTSGNCQITNALAGVNKVKVYTSDGLSLVRNLKLTKNLVTGQYSFTLPASNVNARLNGTPCAIPSATCYKMTAGTYYAVLQTTYSFHGLVRTWYQIFGFKYR